MEDKNIIELYWQRSENAIYETSAKYNSYCYSISYGILSDEEDAKECVNDTWLKVWNAIPPERPLKLSVFLGKITRNLSIDRYRKSHAQKRNGGQMEVLLSELEECIPNGNSVEQEVEGKLLTECLNQFVCALPEEKQVMFVLRYWYAMRIKDIANKMGITENKVSIQLFRMRAQLKEHLQKEGLFL